MENETHNKFIPLVVGFNFKGTFYPQIKTTYFSFYFWAIYPSGLF